MVSVSSWVSFDNFYLSRNLSVSSQCGLYWHKAVHNSILLSSIVCWICSDVLSFIPDNWFVWVFFLLVIFAFFLHQSLKRFISFTVCFFLIDSWLYWYSLLFPVFYFVNSCSWLSYFFLYLRVFQPQCYWHYRPNDSVLSIIVSLAASLASPHRIQ